LANITMKELLEAGVHFGHQTKRWNPRMKEYIFGERNGIYIIDLQKTLKMFKEASKFVTELTSSGKLVLFVGTKRQAQDAIAEEANRCGMPYINSRWLGGLLTNWVTVQKSVKRLQELDDMSTDGRYDLLTKKEVIKLERERKHLSTNLSGIKSMKRLPDALFVVDSNNEAIAVAEARKLGIPVVAVVDTNCDPTDGGLCDSWQRRCAACDPAVYLEDFGIDCRRRVADDRQADFGYARGDRSGAGGGGASIVGIRGRSGRGGCFGRHQHGRGAGSGNAQEAGGR
jgi:ribosomal protein S2